MSSDPRQLSIQFQQEQRNAIVRAYALTRSAMLHEFGAVMNMEPKPTWFAWTIDGRPQTPNDAALKALDAALEQELAEFDRRAKSR